jgi:hypothetical protein
MNERHTEKRISQLGDVELVRLLTRSATENTPEVIAIATAEASRRGLPIDEAFIPPVEDQTASAGGEAAGVSECCRFEAGGTPVLCAHCSNDSFEARHILLNTRGLTFLKLDWLNRSATALVCAKCGRIQLFAVPPVALDDGA